jgi:hypothetical protein
MIKKYILLILVIYSSQLQAGGLVVDILKPVIGKKNAESLDDAHDRFRNAVPPYKAIEEGASGAVRHITTEAFVESNAPILAGLIQASRADARNAGVYPIPNHIKNRLRGYFDDSLLSSIRYRVGQGHELSLQANSFRFGDAVAIALIDTIVFSNSYDSQNNVVLWAHEIAHIQQYNSWGLMDFAKRYLRDYGGVEAGADNVASRYAVWDERRQYTQAPNTYFNRASVQNNPISNLCGTHMGQCILPSAAPLGMSCYCGTYYGPVYGSVVP